MDNLLYINIFRGFTKLTNEALLEFLKANNLCPELH